MDTDFSSVVRHDLAILFALFTAYQFFTRTTLLSTKWCLVISIYCHMGRFGTVWGGSASHYMWAAWLAALLHVF
jgi:hypothetical protein